MNKLRLIVALASAAVLSVGSHAQTRLSLGEMYALADSLNPSIVAARWDATQAREGVDVAKNAYLPDIEISASVGFNALGYSMDRNFKNAENVHIPHLDNSLQLSVSQVVYAGGAIKYGIKAAETAAQLKELGLQNCRQEVRYLIASTSLDIEKLGNHICVMDENISLIEELLGQMQSRFENGAALKTDITRYELQLENLKYARLQTASAREILQRRLSDALGLDETVIPLLEDYEDMPLEGGNYWMENTMQNSSAVRSASLAVDLSRTQERITKGSLHPTIALYATDRLYGPETSTFIAGLVSNGTPINCNFNFFTMGVGIKYNIDNLYKGGRRVRQAESATRKAQSDLDDTRRQLSTAAASAYISYRDAFEAVSIRERSVSLAKENYDLVNSRYDNGLALITEMLDASNQLLDSQMQLVNARMDVMANYFSLGYISGTL